MLNDSHMLPERVRNIRQMKDVLDAEDLVIAEIEAVIEEMYQRAELLHEELVNEAWLEEKLGKIVDGAVAVGKQPEELLVNVLIQKGILTGINETAVLDFLNKWLPAHLAYEVLYEKILNTVHYAGMIWQDDEVMIMREVRL